MTRDNDERSDERSVGLGIVGLGRWSNAHADAVARSPHVRLVDCHARSEDTRSQFMARHGVTRSSTSIEALIENPAVEAVIVSTPNDLHVDHVKMVIAAGKPALVDKPVSVDIAEGLGLLRLVERSGVQVGVAHHARRLGGVRAAREWIESGQSGAVRIGHADFSNARGAHLKPDAWHRTVRGSEAGVLIQVGIHPVENMLYLLGPATSVNARFEYRELGPHMPDAAAVMISHASGAFSVVTSSWTTPGHFRMDLLAVNGNLAYRLDHGHWSSAEVDDHGELVLDPIEGPVRPHPVKKGDPLRAQVEELATAARGGVMTVGVVDGLRAMLVVMAAVESSRNDGAPIDIADLLRRADATGGEIDQLITKRTKETP